MGGLPESPHKTETRKPKLKAIPTCTAVPGITPVPRILRYKQVGISHSEHKVCVQLALSVPREVKRGQVAKHRCAPLGRPAGDRWLAVNFLPICFTFELTSSVGWQTQPMVKRDCNERSSHFYPKEVPLMQSADPRYALWFGTILTQSCFLPLAFQMLSFCINK